MELPISPDLQNLISQRASAFGFESPEAYLRALVTQAPILASRDLTDEEFDRLLAELSSDDDVPILPEGFSRADIYADSE